MASYHFTLKHDKKPSGEQISASCHAQYIVREDRYKNIDEKRNQEKSTYTDPKSHAQYINREAAFENRGGCVHKDSHLPSWAKGSPKSFFETADIYEDAKNTRYREIEFALPIELNLDQQKEVVNEFVKNHLGDDFYWALAIHEKEAAMGNGERNPHVHIMFSERKLDDIEINNERSPETFFKYYNRYHPENGGCRKDEKWNGSNRIAYLCSMRKDCAAIQNRILEKYNYDVTVDHRTLFAQREEAIKRGDFVLAQLLTRSPEKNVGPKFASHPNNEKVIELQTHRQLKSEHRKLIIAADVLQKSIIKDETIQSTDNSQEQASIVLSDIKNKNLEIKQELKDLTNSIVKTSQDLSILRNLIIWDAAALADARRYYMTPEELQLETESKDIAGKKFNLKRQQKELRKPTDVTAESVKQYTDKKNNITSQLAELNILSKELGLKLKTVNIRLSTNDLKIKIAKKQQQILDENQPIKTEARQLQIDLNNYVTKTQSIISSYMDTQAAINNDRINKLLADKLPEKIKLETQLAELAKQKAYIDTHPILSFKPGGREQYELLIKLKGDIKYYDSKLGQINREIETIKNAKYEPEIEQKSQTITEPKQFVQTTKSETTSAMGTTNTIPPITPKTELQTNSDNTISSNDNIERIRFTARKISSILDLQIKALTEQISVITPQIETIKNSNSVYTDAQAYNMAKNNFVQRGFSKLRSENQEIKKVLERITKDREYTKNEMAKFNAIKDQSIISNINTGNLFENKLKDLDAKEQELNQRKKANERKTADLEARCGTSIAKSQIRKIADQILKDNKPQRDIYNHLCTEKDNLSKSLGHLNKLKTAADKQATLDRTYTDKVNKPEVKWELNNTKTSSKKPGLGGGTGGSRSNDQNAMAEMAKAIAAHFANDSKIAALRAYTDDEENEDWGMLTEEQKETLMAKMRIERSM